jgi:hypothetical protein
MTSLKIRFLFKNLKINHFNLLVCKLNIINYSLNINLKKKHLIYKIIKKQKNK